MSIQSEKKDNIIKRMKELTLLLGGTFEMAGTLNSVGRSSNKIIIEYDIKSKDD